MVFEDLVREGGQSGVANDGTRACGAAGSVAHARGLTLCVYAPACCIGSISRVRAAGCTTGEGCTALFLQMACGGAPRVEDSARCLHVIFACERPARTFWGGHSPATFPARCSVSNREVHSGEWWKANGNGTAGTSLQSGPAWYSLACA